MGWHIILFLIFVIIGTGLGIFLFFKKKGGRFANVLLGVYTLLFSYELLYKCLYWSGTLITKTFSHLVSTNFPIWLIYGPLVYVYVRHVKEKKKFVKRDLLFLIPPLLIIMLNSPFYLLAATEKMEVLNSGNYADHTWIPKGTVWVVSTLMFFYAFLTYYDFGPRKKVGFRENQWLKWFVGSYFGFVVAFFSYVLLTRLGWFNPDFDYLVDIVIVLFISILAFFGFVQPDVFEGKDVNEVIPFIKYQKTGLSDGLALVMKEKLRRIMANEKPYLDHTIRMEDLADKLNLSRNHTSQIINQHYNLSFFDFVNKYRVEEAKKLLAQNEKNNANITQIVYDSGFGNRASFYKAFRKFEGQTPTQYLNRSNFN